jgi:hypothetical protein
MAKSLAPELDDKSRWKLFIERLNMRDVTESESSSGNALWIVGSFMNHSTMPTVAKELFGGIMFIWALFPLKAGDELTICYSADPSNLHQWGIA